MGSDMPIAGTDNTEVTVTAEPDTNLPDTIEVPDSKAHMKSNMPPVPDGISGTVILSMGAIADTNGMWGTDAGKKLIDSLKRFYAEYDIIATFDRIKVTLHYASKETIKNLCVDPGAGEAYDTEYACTVNYPEQNKDVVASIYAMYYQLRERAFPAIDGHSVFSSTSRYDIIPGYDSELLTFNIYVYDKLPHIQVKNILVHELKHCMILYAVVQRLVSLYVRSPHETDATKYVEWYGKYWMALNAKFNAYLDTDVEKFDPDIEYVSRRDIIPFIREHKFLVPMPGKTPNRGGSHTH